MHWLPVLTLWFMLQAGSRHWAQRIRALRALDQELAELEALGRAGTSEGLHDERRRQGAAGDSGALFGALYGVIESARRQGLPWHRSLGQLRRLLRRVERIQTRAHHQWRMFASRAWIAVGFATGASVLLANKAEASAQWGWAAALMAASVSWALRLMAPSSLWMSQQADARLLAWFACHLDGQERACVPEGERIRGLAHRELRLGIELMAEKRRVLEAWARREHRQQLRLVQQWCELMPLAELLGLGAPMALILAHPALAWLG